jgi:hypothetical protein
MADPHSLFDPQDYPKAVRLLSNRLNGSHRAGFKFRVSSNLNNPIRE